MKNLFEVAPGAVWAAIIVALVLLSDWLTKYFGGAPWVPALTGFVTAVLVPVLKILVQGDNQGAEPRGVRNIGDTDSRSLLSRWLW